MTIQKPANKKTAVRKCRHCRRVLRDVDGNTCRGCGALVCVKCAVADGLEVARIGSELATADQLGEWPNVEGFQVEAANFLAGIMPPAPVTPPGGEE